MVENLNKSGTINWILTERTSGMIHKITPLFKREAVLIISAAFAVLTMFFVEPSLEYIKYIDFRVLALLFSLMAVVAGLQENGVFLILSEKLLSKVKTVRGCAMC